MLPGNTQVIVDEPDSGASQAVVPAILLGLGVFLLCLLGIFTRPHLDLAALWPANAFMLGMLVRFPSLATPLSWVGCAAGFFAADAMTGSTLTTNIVLNVGNLAAIGTGYWLFTLMPPQDRRLQTASSIVSFLGAVLGACLVAGLVGALANPVLFDDTASHGFVFWFATELVNYTAFLPVLLTLPDMAKVDTARLWRNPARSGLTRIMPLLALVALVASAAAGVVIGGPGAVAFPVPALLWCALTYNIFTTACLAFCFSAWTLLAIRLGLLSIGAELESRPMLISARVGVTLVALGPLVVASVMAARAELLEKLRLLADQDAITGLRNRRAFFESGASALGALANSNRPIAVMMLDIDHFKAINDNHGHAAGDRLLTVVGETLAHSVRPEDTVGRIGGEEFAVLLPGCELDEARRVATKINAAFRSASLALDNGKVLTVTISIGVHVDRRERNLDRLLAFADGALYRAKQAGRNRFEISAA